MGLAALSSQLVACPSCGYSAKVRARSGKTELRCPRCGKEFNVWF